MVFNERIRTDLWHLAKKCVLLDSSWLRESSLIKPEIFAFGSRTFSDACLADHSPLFLEQRGSNHKFPSPGSLQAPVTSAKVRKEHTGESNQSAGIDGLKMLKVTTILVDFACWSTVACVRNVALSGTKLLRLFWFLVFVAM